MLSILERGIMRLSFTEPSLGARRSTDITSFNPLKTFTGIIISISQMERLKEKNLTKTHNHTAKKQPN